MVRATSADHRFFPTAVAIEDYTKAAEKTARRQPNYELMAISGETQRLHGLPPSNKFEQLARKWERDNSSANPDCSRRCAELIAAFVDANGPLAHDLAGEIVDWKKLAAGEKDEAA